MSGNDPGGRRYSDEEFALILRRASEISAAGDARPGGLSLSEMQQIAQEAGIDPAAVRRAAASLPAQSRSTLTAIFGGPMKYRLERTLPGKASGEDLSRILQSIRRTTEHQGRTEHILDSVEWRTADGDEGSSRVFVNVTAREEGTTIEVMGDRQAAGVLTYALSGFAAVMGSVLLVGTLEPSLALGIAIGGVVGGAFMVTRTIWSRSGAAFRRKLGAIMDEASRTAESALGQSGAGPAAPSSGDGGGGPRDG